MGVFEALKKGFEVLKGSTVLILTIVGFNFITALGMLMVIGVNPTPEKITSITGTLLVLFPILLLLWIFMEGGIFSAVYGQIKTKQINLSVFIENCVKYFVRLLTINCIGGAVTIVLWFIGAFLTGLCIAMGGGNNVFFNAMGGILLLITVIAAFLVAIPLLIGQYFAVIEDGKAIVSLKKGIAFTKQLFWKNSGLFVMLAIILAIFSFIGNFFGSLLTNTVGGWVAAIVNITLNSAINGLVGVFASGTIISFLLGSLTAKTEEIE
ncbi:MAG: hypothetical protein KKD05_05255 [Candidatus Omnitrophica bacterium]|nr:hypothetical protein [Candidatus Omnitrophota bacterium]